MNHCTERQDWEGNVRRVKIFSVVLTDEGFPAAMQPPAPVQGAVISASLAEKRARIHKTCDGSAERHVTFAQYRHHTILHDRERTLLQDVERN